MNIKFIEKKVMLKKVSISLLWCFIGCASSTLSCDVIIERGDNVFNSQLYNELSDVEVAHKKLQENPYFNDFLEDGRKIAEKYNLEDYFGVGLAHKHTVLGDNKILIEDYDGSTYGKEALVTKIYELGIDEEGIDYFPTSWMLGNNGYEACEYSTDPEVQKGYQHLSENPEFLNEFLSITKRYNLDGLLVPAILPRIWYSTLGQDTVPVESIYLNPFAMVVTGESTKNVSPSDLFQTTWNLGLEPIKLKNCLKIKYCLTWNGSHTGVQGEYHQQL